MDVNHWLCAVDRALCIKHSHGYLQWILNKRETITNVHSLTVQTQKKTTLYERPVVDLLDWVEYPCCPHSPYWVSL
jgi:hypothetical protein